MIEVCRLGAEFDDLHLQSSMASAKAFGQAVPALQACARSLWCCGLESDDVVMDHVEGTAVVQVARADGLNANQVFKWRCL